MTSRVTLLLLLLLVSLAMGFAADPPAPTTYDLHAVVTRALAANPIIRASRQAVTTAQAKVGEAQAGQRPKVQGEAGYLQLAKDPSFTVSPMGTLVFGKTENPWANVSLDWSIYSGGVIQNMIVASRQGVDAAWQGYARTQQETVAEAATAYYQVLSAQQMVAVMQQQVTTLTEAVRVATGLHDQGVVAKLDVLRPTSDMASAQTMLTQADNGVQLATANLKRLLNLPQETVITVIPTADAALAPPALLPAATQTALAQRPEMKQLQAYLRATEAQREIARAGRHPQVGLHAQYDFERATTYPDMGSWTVAVVLRQPLYDGGTSKAQLAAATSQRDELRDQEEALRQGITMQVTSAVLNLQSAEKKVQSATLARTTAEEAYTAAVISYKNQVVPMIDVLGAQMALTNASTQLALAEFERQTALIQYHLALGDAPVATTQDAKL
jgi:outer membrane protein TolC